MFDLGAFHTSRLPAIHFGAGCLAVLPGLVGQYSGTVLLVRGQRSLCAGSEYPVLCKALGRAGIRWLEAEIPGEPSPALVDGLVAEFRPMGISVVVGIGGGSVLDAAKAIAGLLPLDCSVLDFLEGVGPQRIYPGPALPFIAVPTTAGTGSEATKNAVLSLRSSEGYKKSFRAELLVAQHAIVDPDLLRTCPPDLVAANGMDALTQLLESYVSLKANAFSDALAWSGLERVVDALPALYFSRDDDRARAGMAYAALLSGITLAQVGLGSVHGLAAPLGAFFPIPHGVACGTLVAEATHVNIVALRERQPDAMALQKYAQVAKLFTGQEYASAERACQGLVDYLTQLTETLALPRLSVYGIGESDVARVVANSRGSSMQTNPVVLSDDEISRILFTRL